MRQALHRLLWACVCFVVWPAYYAKVMLEALPLWLVPDHLGWNARLHDELRSPPYLDRLRAGGL
jgi:hypothetical protein